MTTGTIIFIAIFLVFIFLVIKKNKKKKDFYDTYPDEAMDYVNRHMDDG